MRNQLNEEKAAGAIDRAGCLVYGEDKSSGFESLYSWGESTESGAAEALIHRTERGSVRREQELSRGVSVQKRPEYRD